MKYIIYLFILILSGCDTIAIKPTLNGCIVHWWDKAKIFKIEKYDDKYIYLKNIYSSESKRINYFSKGWSSTQCEKSTKVD